MKNLLRISIALLLTITLSATFPEFNPYALVGSYGESRPIALCTASNLKAVGGREGAAQSAVGEIILENAGKFSCRLAGVPGIYLETTRGARILHITYGKPSTPIRPLVVKSRKEARLLTGWSNWCGGALGPLDLAVTLPQKSGSLVVPFNGPPNYGAVPQCVNRSGESEFQIGSGYDATTYPMPRKIELHSVVI